MASPDGVRYLSTEDQFMSEIVKSFAQLDPVRQLHDVTHDMAWLILSQFNGVPDSDPMFSKKRVAETLTYGYLEFLGTLSKYKDGIEWVFSIGHSDPYNWLTFSPGY